MIPRVWLVPVQGGLVNTHGGQRGLLHQLSPMCTFSVGIVAMAHLCPEGRRPPRYARRRLIKAFSPGLICASAQDSGARPDGTPAAPRYSIADLPTGEPWKGFFEVRQRLPG